MAKANFLLAAVIALVCGCAANTQPNWRVKQEPELRMVEKPASVVQTNVSDLATAAAKPSAAFEGAGWKTLLAGRDLAGWDVTDFTGHGLVTCENGLVVIDAGTALSGLNYTNVLPRMNYEVALDAMKLEGTDFFCGLTFPVGESHCSLILGGWGGTLVGLSSLDEQDASENETTDFVKFDNEKWYRVRVRVTETKIEAWIDGKRQVNVTTTGRRIGLRFGEIELSKPLGVATYQTRAALRNVKVRELSAEEMRNTGAQKN